MSDSKFLVVVLGDARMVSLEESTTMIGGGLLALTRGLIQFV